MGIMAADEEAQRTGSICGSPAEKVTSTNVPLQNGQISCGISKDEKDQGRSSLILVAWEGQDDPDMPKNWSSGRKWRTLIAVSGFVLMSPLSTTIVAPSLDIIASDLDIPQSSPLKPMVLSIFLLGFALGPLCISPLSEIYGRVRVLQLFNLGYLAFNTACGGARTEVQILVFRLLAGIFGSASVGIGAGTIGDMFRASERGKAMAVYSLAPLIGPIIGPIAGGFLTQYASWRWAFYLASIVDALAQIWGLFFLEESYAPSLLRRKRERLERAAGPQSSVRYYTEYDLGKTSEVMRRNMIRPLKLLATQPVVQVLALYQGYLYGNIYILYADFPSLWTGRYGESVSIASLNYLSLGIGTAFAAEVTTHINDRIYRYLTTKNERAGGTGGRPEFRVPIMLPATLLLSVGLFWYGWSAEAHLHWIMPNIGVAIFTAAAYVCTLSNNTYIVDTYGQYSASALAAISMLRCLTGFGFPLFAPFVYNRLGYGWTNSLFGFLALGIGVPAVIGLWLFGRVLRAKSAYCRANEGE